ncbi:hypothetical protein NDK50_07825 [Paraburkholderia bryophila]|uniref:hypothetical protein n=1 Tax=Paraburkholderia bryophila TaxID=420952 RepID=UPI00234BF040|nr:hypothetical protein [Paraburkholderia bryophila]WCM21344.1 hypothetical protein NDK50_07825 [Paraburkholderia bryophila]
MSEIEVINQRLQKGDERFAEVTDALSRITTHLQSQDATMASLAGKLDKVVDGTDSIVGMWNGGVKTVRFFCRAAEAWTFMLKKVLFPFGSFALVMTILFSAWSYVEYGRFPEWVSAVFKLILAVL